MKRSELKLTGEKYRLTPDSWGENFIMVDEDEIQRETAEAFSLPVDECDPDADPNNRPDSVEIATDAVGNFYAILVPFTTSDGRVHNDNMYRPCDDPTNATRGSASLYGNTWEIFDEEEN